MTTDRRPGGAGWLEGVRRTDAFECTALTAKQKSNAGMPGLKSGFAYVLC